MIAAKETMIAAKEELQWIYRRPREIQGGMLQYEGQRMDRYKL